MARLADRFIDLISGDWERGRVIDTALPAASRQQRRAAVRYQREGDTFRRSYKSARQQSFASDFGARASLSRMGYGGPRNSIAFDLGYIRRQARHIATTNPHAQQAIRIRRDWTVGTGINMSPKPKRKAVGTKLDPIWRRWFGTSECDVSRHSNFFEMQRLIAQSIFEGGEVIVRLRPRKISDNLSVPLAIEVLEGEYIYDGAMPLGVLSGNLYASGIEFSPIGLPVAYWLYKSHPLEPGMLDRTPVRVPVIDPITGMRQISHLFEKLRPGQIRGIPRAATVLDTVYDQADLRSSLLHRKRAEAKLVWKLTQDTNADSSAPPPLLGVEDTAPFAVDSDDGPAMGPAGPDGPSGDDIAEYVQEQLLQDVSVIPMQDGWKLQESQLTAASDYTPFMADLHRAMATGFGVPYEIMSGDLKGVTYSSAKVGLLQFKGECEAFQDYLISELCEFVWQGFVIAGNRAGLWADTSIPCLFRADRFPSVEPQKDIGVLIIKLRNGMISPRRACAELGEDFDELLAEIAEDKGRLEALNIDLYGTLKTMAALALPKISGKTGTVS